MFIFIGDTDVPKHKTFELQTTSDDAIKIQITMAKRMCTCVFGATLLCCFYFFMVLVVAIVILLIVLCSIGHVHVDM